MEENKPSFMGTAVSTPIVKKKLKTNTLEVQAQKPDNLGAQGCTCKCPCQTSIIQYIKSVTDLKSFQLIMDKEWDDKVFQKTKIEVGNPLSEEDVGVKVVLTELNDCALAYKNYIGKNTGTRAPARRPGDNKIKQDGSVPDVWRKLSELRDETANDAKIALHHITGMTVKTLRKMVETIFRTSSTQIKIYTTGKK
ncbi:hypothetical protein JTB14_020795 [Gonioctena quinquepunctata]|nr:hypothetical protein JTB14_020795 [Gonioctena quinquepunctata]